MSHTNMWHETATIHSPIPVWNSFPGSHITEGHEPDTPSCTKPSGSSPVSPSKTIRHCNWRTFHKLQVLIRSLRKCSFRDVSRGHWPVLHEVLSSTRAGFTLANTSRASPRKLRQSSELTRFVSTLKLPSLILLFAQKCAKKSLYWRTGPSPFSGKIHIALLMILVKSTLCKISLRRFWLNFRIQKENK